MKVVPKILVWGFLMYVRFFFFGGVIPSHGTNFVSARRKIEPKYIKNEKFSQNCAKKIFTKTKKTADLYLFPLQQPWTEAGPWEHVGRWRIWVPGVLSPGVPWPQVQLWPQILRAPGRRGRVPLLSGCEQFVQPLPARETDSHTLLSIPHWEHLLIQ